MLNSDDPATIIATRELVRIVRESGKPLVFWIGAGASAWLGYPLWKELARQLRRDFFKFVDGFDNSAALNLIEEKRFPEFFQMCREKDRQRYFRLLSESFLPRADTNLYIRFIDLVSKNSPLRILTTNIDENLEQRLPHLAVYQSTDIVGCLDRLADGREFIAKLHGSRSAIETAVFTRSDYERLIGRLGYRSNIRQIFASATVVFLGYGVGDQYVIDLLSDNAQDMSLFGAGPHFVVASDFKSTANLRRIGYSLRRYPDHRAALAVLDLIQQAKTSSVSGVSVSVETSQKQAVQPTANSETGYFISDFTPAGTWNSSTTAQLGRPDGIRAQVTVGIGFTNQEIPFTESTAAHDLLVGLICFDRIYLPLSALHRLQSLIGDWTPVLLRSNALSFVHLQNEPGVVRLRDSFIGHIGHIAIAGEGGTVAGSIRRQLKAVPNKEKEAQELFAEIEARTVTFADADEMDLPRTVRASFMMPEVARLLGIGEAILPSQIPDWLTFPCLRMAHLVYTGAVCERFHIQSAKLPFGGERLTTAAFGTQPSGESAGNYASYVFSGRFDANIGAILASRPEILAAILRFRDSSEGLKFRDEVRNQLRESAIAHFIASVNAGLGRNIPVPSLQVARDHLSTLMAQLGTISHVRAVWADSRALDDSTRRWRERSRALLLEQAKTRGIGRDDACLCGSGDKLRLCCLQPLRD